MPNDSYGTVAMCPERLRLFEAVSKAIEAIYSAKSAHEQAILCRTDASALAVTLSDSGKAQNEAISALNTHRKVHGC